MDLHGLWYVACGMWFVGQGFMSQYFFTTDTHRHYFKKPILLVSSDIPPVREDLGRIFSVPASAFL